MDYGVANAHVKARRNNQYRVRITVAVNTENPDGCGGMERKKVPPRVRLDFTHLAFFRS